jgi:hypothetical protein
MRKLENWLTYGGAFLAVVAFFNIDFSKLNDWAGAMSARTAIGIIGAVGIIVGIVLKLRERTVRIVNVQRKVDGWLRSANYAFRENVEWPNWHFGFEVTEPGVRTWVA